jgi:hypothetical protein
MNARAMDNKTRPNELYATTLDVNTSNENIQNSNEEGNLNKRMFSRFGENMELLRSK